MPTATHVQPLPALNVQPYPVPPLPVDAASGAQYAALIDANAAVRSQATAQIMQQAIPLITSFTGWYADSQVATMAEELALRVTSVQNLVTAQEDWFLSQVLSAMQHGVVAPKGAAHTNVGYRVGTTNTEAYARLGEQYRYSRSIGGDHEQALRAVLSRADAMASMDVQAAARHQDQKVLTDTKHVIGYRRILRPYRSVGGSCGMCIAASHRVYKKSELLPIHARCKCGVMPITAGHDPGADSNKIELSQLYEDAGGNTRKDLKRTRYQVDEHGEWQAVLVPKKRGAKPIDKRPSLSLTERERIERTIAITEAMKDSQWRTDRLAALRKKLAGLG